MLNITTFPIIIISSPRTGSTVLAHELAHRYNLTLFNEIILGHPQVRLMAGEPYDPLSHILSLIKNNENNFILKIHLDDLPVYPNEILNIIYTHRCTSIKLRRRDIASQITSYYIEATRKIWAYSKEYTDSTTINDLTTTEIPIELPLLIKCITRITKEYRALTNLVYEFDKDFWYEDLIFTDQTFIITPKPNNYYLIRNKIKETLLTGLTTSK